MVGSHCSLVLGRRPSEGCDLWAFPFHSAYRNVSGLFGFELLLRPLLDSYRGLVAFLDTGSEQVCGWRQPFDDHLGVVSLDDDADGSLEGVCPGAVVVLVVAGVTGVVGFGVGTSIAAFHCCDLSDGVT